jgi:hypothetical protein
MVELSVHVRVANNAPPPGAVLDNEAARASNNLECAFPTGHSWLALNFPHPVTLDLNLICANLTN